MTRIIEARELIEVYKRGMSKNKVSISLIEFIYVS